MLYEVLLKTKCEYARAASGRQLLRLLPADGLQGQRLIAGAIDVRPAPSERLDRYDFFGNRATEVRYAKGQHEMEFIVRARVDRFAEAPKPPRSPALSDLSGEIAALQSLEPLSPHHFTGASPLVRRSPAIDDYVAAIGVAGMTVFEAVSAINLSLHNDMAYDSVATTVETPMEVAFAERRGVCQDFTHIMIAALRQIGVPAGYVSGFLRTEPPKGKPRLEGADAMHAWVQAWCGMEAGWIEFDPTNAMLVGTDHIVAARGRDYSDVAPVKGVLRMAGDQKISQTVDVIPLG